jgi:hypothetical protein
MFRRFTVKMPKEKMSKEKMSNEKTSNKICPKTNVEQKNVERKKSTKKNVDHVICRKFRDAIIQGISGFIYSLRIY